MTGTGLLVQLLCILLQGVLRGGADENEYRLTRFLLRDYDASVRPVENSSLPLTVTFGISLHHIIDVDEKNQILTTNCWLTHVWTDHHLRWNASEFAGIKVVRLPYTRVWKPDVILYNNADSQYSNAVINTNVIVSSGGEVVWLSHGIYRSSCDINVEFFPFDVQSCQMKWASWTYDGYQVWRFAGCWQPRGDSAARRPPWAREDEFNQATRRLQTNSLSLCVRPPAPRPSRVSTRGLTQVDAGLPRLIINRFILPREKCRRRHRRSSRTPNSVSRAANGLCGCGGGGIFIFLDVWQRRGCRNDPN